MMATTQTTLQDIDRGGCTSTKNTQIVLSWADSSPALTPASAHRSMRHHSFEDFHTVDRSIREKGSPAYFDSGDAQIVHVFGTDFEALLVDIETVIQRPAVDTDGLIIDGLQQLGSTGEEIRTRLRQLREILAPNGVELAIIEPDSIGSEIHTVDPSSSEFDWMLRTLDLAGAAALRRDRESVKSEIRRWVNWDLDGGRASLGFEWVDNELVPAGNYEEVCATLELVRDGEMSKRKAAAHLNTSPRTITRCLDERSERYGL